MLSENEGFSVQVSELSDSSPADQSSIWLRLVRVEFYEDVHTDIPAQSSITLFTKKSRHDK